MGQKLNELHRSRKKSAGVSEIGNDYTSKYGFNVPEKYVFKSQRGLNEGIVRQISNMKSEPDWMLDFRLKAYKTFVEKPMHKWGPDLSAIDFNNIYYYLKPTENQERTWEDVPADIKNTFDRLGIPEAEKLHLSGVKAQFDSEIVYGSLLKELEEQGVIFLGTDEALKKYPHFFEEYFGKVIPPNDNKFAALNSAVWSGGSFVYIPKGVSVKRPLQAYFRINAQNMGQFERTLIIADEGSYAHYVEGCFTKGHRILTSLEVKKIEDIQTGDSVLTHKGTYKNVYHTQVRSYTGTLYTINVTGNIRESIEVTEEHPFLTVKRKTANERNKKYKMEWVGVKNLKAKDYLAVPIIKENVISKTIKRTVIYRGKKEEIIIPCTPDFFRLIGYYLAEGSIENRGYLKFSFNRKETVFINDVKSIVIKLFNHTKFYEFEGADDQGYELVICSAKLARIFKEFGTKANKKSLPNWVLLEDKKKQKELIKGYFRGDGNYYKKKLKTGLKEIIRVNTVSQVLSVQIRDVLLRLGIISFINERDRSKEDRQTMYTVGVGGWYLSKLGKILNIRTFSKLNNHNRATPFSIDDNYAYLPIKSIKKRYVENTVVYNFSVKENESYTVNGFAVHNCTAPVYSSDSLHAAVVEVIVKPGARFRYTTIQNWSKDVYNLVTKRARVEKNAIMEWIDGNLGSKITQKYPSCYLVGEGAHGEVLSIAYAGHKKQHQDAGAKMVHIAPNTTSTIISKSISVNGGRTSYRGLVSVTPSAKNAKSHVECDALILDDKSASDTFPVMKINESSASIEHEATVSKIGGEKLFYLMSRGLTEPEAMSLIVSGFIEPIVKELPLEYAVELNRLIELEMEGSVG